MGRCPDTYLGCLKRDRYGPGTPGSGSGFRLTTFTTSVLGRSPHSCLAPGLASCLSSNSNPHRRRTTAKEKARNSAPITLQLMLQVQRVRVSGSTGYHRTTQSRPIGRSHRTHNRKLENLPHRDSNSEHRTDVTHFASLPSRLFSLTPSPEPPLEPLSLSPLSLSPRSADGHAEASIPCPAPLLHGKGHPPPPRRRGNNFEQPCCTYASTSMQVILSCNRNRPGM